MRLIQAPTQNLMLRESVAVSDESLLNERSVPTAGLQASPSAARKDLSSSIRGESEKLPEAAGNVHWGINE